ncbi:uncharacterized protein LOC136042575 [Artemia franciscana]|uniref:uncharacterized protein LOC136042575 n=1 Tax=Artemia franciscana TaxID=6661 RepID=UPI0032D9EDA6
MKQNFLCLVFLPFSFCQNLVIFDDFENLDVSNNIWVDNDDWEITADTEFVPLWKTKTLRFKDTNEEVKSRSLCTKQVIDSFNCLSLRLEVKIPSNAYTNSDRLKIEVIDSVNGSRVVLRSFGSTPLVTWLNFTVESEKIPLKQYQFCVTGNYSTFRQEILVSRLYAIFTEEEIVSTGTLTVSSTTITASSIYSGTTHSSKTSEGTIATTMAILPTTAETGTPGQPPYSYSVPIGLVVSILVLSGIAVFLAVVILLTLRRKQNKLEAMIETINRTQKNEEAINRNQKNEELGERFRGVAPYEMTVPVCYSNQAHLA